MGAPQLAPLSKDRMSARRLVATLLAALSICVKKSTMAFGAPAAAGGSATIWLLSVWLRLPGSKITRAGSHVVPLFVVREKYVGPLPDGTSRSHAAYT